MTQTNFASSNRTGIRYAIEQSWATIPASGVTRQLRYTSSSLAVKKGTTESTEIRDDRMVSDIVETDMSANGDFKWEFSAGAQDDFFCAFLMGAWTRPMTFDEFQGDLLSWTSVGTLSIAGANNSEIYSTGRRVKTNGFVNPGNNGYWTVSTSVYNAAAGRTDLTLSGATTSVVEQGGTTARLYDANDVIVLSNTAIRAGTAGASTFDSNGTNAFASAIAAGQLVLGQNIHVGGLGAGTATVTVASQPTAGDTLVLNDGTDLALTLTAGTSYAIGSTAAITATNIATAINQARVGASPVALKATVATDVVTITNLKKVGGSVTAPTNTNTALTVVTFAGGDATVGGVFTIVGLTSDVITVTPTPDTNANAGTLPVTIKGSMLRNPGVGSQINPISFDLETEFNDIGAFLTATGMRVSDMDMDVSATKISTGSFTFMGQQMIPAPATVLGAAPFTVLPATTAEVMNGTTDVGEITKNGASIATAVQQITMKGNNNLRAQQAVSSKFPVGIGTGRLTITGTLVAYFEDFVLYNNFLNHDTIALGWSMADADGQTYYFTLPAVKVTSDPVAPEGMDQDVMEKMDWMAFRDPITACMLQIDRFSSTTPV